MDIQVPTIVYELRGFEKLTALLLLGLVVAVRAVADDVADVRHGDAVARLAHEVRVVVALVRRLQARPCEHTKGNQSRTVVSPAGCRTGQGWPANSARSTACLASQAGLVGPNLGPGLRAPDH